MKVLFWNIRGIGNPSSRMELSNLCKTRVPDILCMAEPMISLYAFPHMFWHSHNFRFLVHNVREALLPRIWILYNNNITPPIIISCTAQQITIQALFDDQFCQVSFVYASTSIHHRRSLWNDLSSLSTSLPLLVLGDFNSVLGAQEKLRGKTPNISSCADFGGFIDNCNLVQMNYSGVRYTWSNKREPGQYMELQLDRSLCSTNWFHYWPISNYLVLPRIVSDHSPLVVSSSRIIHKSPKPFRFLSMWMQHADFKQLVIDTWNSKQHYGC